MHVGVNRICFAFCIALYRIPHACGGEPNARQPDAAEQASRLHIQEAIDLVRDEEVN